MPNIDSIRFDLTDCQVVEQSEMHRMWSRPDGVYHNLRVSPQPPSWAFDLRDLAMATDFYSRQCADNKGVMLAMDVVQAAGVPALRGLFKYRSPVPQSMGMMYVHILWLAFRNWSAQINVESVESGTTGMREAAVMMIEGDNWPMAPPDTQPIEVSSAEEMFEHMRSRPLRIIPSDHEKYDETFADHPLSKVRRRMEQVMASLTIDAAPGEMAQFSKRAWWQLWRGW